MEQATLADGTFESARQLLTIKQRELRKAVGDGDQDRASAIRSEIEGIQKSLRPRSEPGPAPAGVYPESPGQPTPPETVIPGLPEGAYSPRPLIIDPSEREGSPFLPPLGEEIDLPPGLDQSGPKVIDLIPNLSDIIRYDPADPSASEPSPEDFSPFDEMVRESAGPFPPDATIEELQRERQGGADTLPQIFERVEELNGERFPPPADMTSDLLPDPDRPFTIEPQGVDMMGVPIADPGQSDATVEDLIKNDPSRGGNTVRSPLPDVPDFVEPDAGAYNNKPLSDKGIAVGARNKLFDFLGVDDQDHAQRLGMGLLGFGSGVLTGGSDIGAAIGHGFAKGADQFVATKKGQREAGLEDYDRAIEQQERARKVAAEDRRLEMEAWEFDEARRKAARDRTGEKAVDIETEHKLADYMTKEDGSPDDVLWRNPETGKVEPNPNYDPNYGRADDPETLAYKWYDRAWRDLTDQERNAILSSLGKPQIKTSGLPIGG